MEKRYKPSVPQTIMLYYIDGLNLEPRLLTHCDRNLLLNLLRIPPKIVWFLIHVLGGGGHHIVAKKYRWLKERRGRVWDN